MIAKTAGQQSIQQFTDFEKEHGFELK